MSALRPLLRLAAVPPPRVAFAVLLGGLTVLFGVGLAATSGYLISRAAEHPPILALTTAIVGVRFFALGRPLVRYVERLWTHDLALRALGRVRVEAYERIEPLAPVELEDYRQGDLLSHLVADIDALQGLHLRCFDPPFVALLSGTVAVAVTAVFLPTAAIVLAVGLLAGGIGAPALALRSGRLGRGRAELQGALSAQLVELAQGAPELVAYGREEDCLAELRATDARLVRHARRAALLDGLGEGLLIAITGSTVTAVLAVAVAAHRAAHLDPTLIAMLTLLALASFEAVQPLVQRGRELPELEAAGGRVLGLIDRRPKVADPDTPAAPPRGQASLAFEQVSLQRTAGEDAVLDGFTLRLEAGRRMALLGPSGGGKTTVTNLLLRFLDPDEGRLTLNGVDVRSYRQEDVRRTIAVAEQNGHLFSTTIRENVRLARPAASDEEIWSALRTAGAFEWVQSLERGWDTVVGEQGKKLSGGQRQRLVIARALLANTPVLVLDEPTAHLDPAAAEALITDVIAATAGRSLLLITHRTEGLELVDEVVTLERGRIAA